VGDLLTFRIMVGCGILMFLGLAWGMVLLYRRKLDTSKWFLRLAVPALLLPSSPMRPGDLHRDGRQPWVVYGLLKTAKGVSPNRHRYVVAPWSVSPPSTASWHHRLGLMARYAKLDPDSVDEHGQAKPVGRRIDRGAVRRLRRRLRAPRRPGPGLIY